MLFSVLLLAVLALSGFQKSVSLCVIEAKLLANEKEPLGTFNFTILNNGKTQTTLVEPTILVRVGQVMYSGYFSKQIRVTLKPNQSYKGQINCKELAYRQHSTGKRTDYTAFINLLKKEEFVEACVSYTDMTVLGRHKENENFLVFSNVIRIR